MRITCLLFGHPSEVKRVFGPGEVGDEFKYWRDREQAWVCIRCHREIVGLQPPIPSKWDYEHLNMNGQPMCRTCGEYGYHEWCERFDNEYEPSLEPSAQKKSQ